MRFKKGNKVCILSKSVGKTFEKFRALKSQDWYESKIYYIQYVKKLGDYWISRCEDDYAYVIQDDYFLERDVIEPISELLTDEDFEL